MEEAFYKTALNEFVFDQGGMGAGSNIQNSVKATDSRGRDYKFKYEPTGASTIQVMDHHDHNNSYDEVNVYSGSGQNWLKETFNANTGKLIKSSSYLESEVLNDESWLNKDLNNDERIGDIVTNKVADYKGTKELYEVFSGGLVVDNSGRKAGDYLNPSNSSNNPILLKTADSRGNVKLFEKQSDSYALTYSDNGHLAVPTLYWNDGKSWNKEIFGATGFHNDQVKLDLSQLLIEEDRYDVDLNSDGQIGDRISQTLSDQSKAQHAAGLYKTVSGAYVFDQNNLVVGGELQSPSSALIYNGKPYSFSSEPIIAFGADQSIVDPNLFGVYKYDVFLKPESKWIREKFNSDGQLEQRYEYDHLSKVLTDETIYQYDLNGDGSIGAVIEAEYNGRSHSESFYKINTGDFILGTNGTSIGMSPNNKNCYIKIINLLNSAMNLRRSIFQDDGLQVKVFSGSDDSWIVDKFSNYGEFQSSENYNLAQILHEEINFSTRL